MAEGIMHYKDMTLLNLRALLNLGALLNLCAMGEDIATSTAMRG